MQLHLVPLARAWWRLRRERQQQDGWPAVDDDVESAQLHMVPLLHHTAGCEAAAAAAASPPPGRAVRPPWFGGAGAVWYT